MAIPVNLAMTAAEFRICPCFPPEIGWMACHFSPSGPGLSNLPRALPPGSLLILDDQSPFDRHDSDCIADELAACVQSLDCAALLLDFQRPDAARVRSLTDRLSKSLPCPVAVTPPCARETDAAVFLPPLPSHVPLKDWIAPWPGRDAWLELSLDRETVTLTPQGAQIGPGDFEDGDGFADKKLHCHYSVAVENEKAVFRLWRTPEDLTELIQEAESLGIQRAVGLYQELNAGLDGRISHSGSPQTAGAVKGGPCFEYYGR